MSTSENPGTFAQGVPLLLVTKKQAAAALSISKPTLNRLIARGNFPPPLKIGRAARIPCVDIAHYLEQLRRERGDKLGNS